MAEDSYLTHTISERRALVKHQLIAYCGLICTECPAYVATQVNDWETLEQGAAQAREQLGDPSITAEMGLCDGCTGGGRLSACTADCEVRTCGVTRSVVNCAHCDDYVCDKLARLFEQIQGAQPVLDRIRRSHH
jgi:hypothetical protein